MYQVGAKDQESGRTRMSHFFEHLFFEGTEDMERGKWFDIVNANGGSNNATLVIAGDIDIKETKKLVKKHFSKWEKGVAPLYVPDID